MMNNIKELGGVKVHIENKGIIKASIFENHKYAEEAYTNLNNAGFPCRLVKGPNDDYAIFYDFEV